MGAAVQIAVDTLFVNTADIERAVAGISAHLGLAPFLSFELIVRHGSPARLAHRPMRFSETDSEGGRPR